jgi:hypothetical protein
MHLMTFSNDDRVFSPDGAVNMTPEQAKAHNEAITARELEHWATRPDYFSPAYYKFPKLDQSGGYRPAFYIGERGIVWGIVSTWTGAKLGDIVHAHVFPHNFGGRVVSIRVRGTNGAMYYGRASWDNGDVIGLRRIKTS